MPIEASMGSCHVLCIFRRGRQNGVFNHSVRIGHLLILQRFHIKILVRVHVFIYKGARVCLTSHTHVFVNLLQAHRVMDLLVFARVSDLLVFAFLPIHRRNNRLRAHEGGGKICFELLPVLKYVSPVCVRIF